MELSPKQQVLELINKSKRILIIPGRPDGDSLGSAAALHLVFNKLGKVATTVMLEPLSERLSWLPAIKDFVTTFNGSRDFVVSIDCANTTADKLVYNFQDNKLNIIVTPKSGSFKPEDVSFSEGSFPFDVVITLDAANYDQLGDIYEQQPGLFQTVPVINIDHHASNDYYGTINLVDLTATSTAEVLVGLIESLGSSLVDADVATALLAGIINDTGSFQHSNTTPKSLTIAAQMVGLGARQQDIIRHFFKTKQLSTLKLWGKILSNIQYDADSKLAWSAIPLSDFTETGAISSEAGGVIDELMTSVPEAEIVVLLSERELGVISGSVRTQKSADSSAVAKLFGGGGHFGAAGFKLTDTSIEEATKLLLDKVKEYQAKRAQVSQEYTPAATSSEVTA